MHFLIPLLFFQQPLILDLPNIDKNPYTSSADIEQGKKLYGGRCAGCHGPSGDGGKGANLGVPVLPRAADDKTLYRVIRYGLPETEMPGTFMAQREIWQISAYVRSLGAVSRTAIPGDASRGESLVRGKGGCLNCHAIGMTGGQVGPSLSEIGQRRSAAHLLSKIQNPASDLPEQYRVVSFTTKDGKKVNGIRMNEDTWSIQVRDAGGKFYSFEKSELKDLKVERKSMMPAYGARLSAQELNDIVLYLSGLRGPQ